MLRVAGRMNTDVQGQTSLEIPSADNAEDLFQNILKEFCVLFTPCIRLLFAALGAIVLKKLYANPNIFYMIPFSSCYVVKVC